VSVSVSGPLARSAFPVCQWPAGLRACLPSAPAMGPIRPSRRQVREGSGRYIGRYDGWHGSGRMFYQEQLPAHPGRQQAPCAPWAGTPHHTHWAIPEPVIGCDARPGTRLPLAPATKVSQQSGKPADSSSLSLRHPRLCQQRSLAGNNNKENNTAHRSASLPNKPFCVSLGAALYHLPIRATHTRTPPL